MTADGHAMKLSRSEFIPVRGLRYHVRHWGSAGAPILLVLHGWMDMSASFQFVVDALQGDWHVIAPDWRGFGLTQAGATDAYWFPDYLGDLDAIADRYSPVAPIHLLGHSMGGNVACLYAGVRPHRVASVVNLEGFGLPDARAGDAPGRYAGWLDNLKRIPSLPSYATLDAVAERLRRNNPRLTLARAQFLAPHWAARRDDGRWHILADPAHKQPYPVLYRVEEALACWRRITAAVLWVEGSDTPIWRRWGAIEEARAEIDRRINSIPVVKTRTVADAGHMLQHDQPEVVAQLIEEHCTGRG